MQVIVYYLFSVCTCRISVWHWPHPPQPFLWGGIPVLTMFIQLLELVTYLRSWRQWTFCHTLVLLVVSLFLRWSHPAQHRSQPVMVGIEVTRQWSQPYLRDDDVSWLLEGPLSRIRNHNRAVDQFIIQLSTIWLHCSNTCIMAQTECVWSTTLW